MSLSERLSEVVRACFSGIWIESHEHDEALRELTQLCARESWTLATWDVDRGLRLPGQTAGDAASADPLAAIRALNALAQEGSSALLVLPNFHRLVQPAWVVGRNLVQVPEFRGR